MRIAVTGASGLIGSALVDRLRTDGHDVRRLVRRPAAAADEVTWDPTARTVDLDGLAGTEAVVHLAGAGIGDKRWTDARKGVILRSRVDGTTAIARAVAALDPPPRVLVSQSAIGFYGDTGGLAVDETGPKGEGFLSDVVLAWERSADPAREAGIRVVHPRTGLVMAKEGGAWGRMLPLFRLGLGGRLGDGRQYWSFVTLADEIEALLFLLRSELSGPVNVTAPNPATNAEVTRAVAAAVQRPALLPAPAFALRAVLGDLSSDILGSARVVPEALEKAGFSWLHPDIETAADTLR